MNFKFQISNFKLNDKSNDVGATVRAANVNASATPYGQDAHAAKNGETRSKFENPKSEIRNPKFAIFNCFIAIVMLLVLCSPMLAEAVNETSPIHKPGTTTSSPGNSGDAMDGWLRVALSLAAVVGLIYLARFLIRKSGRAAKLTGAAGPVEIIWRSSLTMKQQLILARMGQRLLLLGVGPGGMTTLSELTDPKEITELLASIEQGKADSFTNMLKSKAEQYVAPSVVGQSSAPRDDSGPAGEAARRLAEKLRAMDKREDRK